MPLISNSVSSPSLGPVHIFWLVFRVLEWISPYYQQNLLQVRDSAEEILRLVVDAYSQIFHLPCKHHYFPPPIDNILFGGSRYFLIDIDYWLRQYAWPRPVFSGRGLYDLALAHIFALEANVWSISIVHRGLYDLQICSCLWRVIYKHLRDLHRMSLMGSTLAAGTRPYLADGIRTM